MGPMPYINKENITRSAAMSASETPELPAAAKRALAEAEERRKLAADRSGLAPELGGRDGPEPVRFGDWEKKGIAVDF
jgi:hypothetical protein